MALEFSKEKRGAGEVLVSFVCEGREVAWELYGP